MAPHEQLADIAKAAPPITITGMSLAGYSMSDWVFALTALYTVLQIVLTLRKVFQHNHGAKSSGCAVSDCPARKP